MPFRSANEHERRHRWRHHGIEKDRDRGREEDEDKKLRGDTREPRRKVRALPRLSRFGPSAVAPRPFWSDILSHGRDHP